VRSLSKEYVFPLSRWGVTKLSWCYRPRWPDISSESPAPLWRHSSVFGCIWHLIMASFGLIGRIDAFDETIESWWNYVERLKQYFEANEVDNTKKVSSLLTLIGGKHIPYSRPNDAMIKCQMQPNTDECLHKGAGDSDEISPIMHFHLLWHCPCNFPVLFITFCALSGSFSFSSSPNYYVWGHRH
jgi:hypothetical protein